MAAGLGYIEFTTGDVLTAASANGYLASQVVMVFASAAARTSAITSPQEGMISYLKDTNATEYNSGSAWVAIGGGGLSSPLTTKGDVWGYSTTNARIPVGTNGQVLTADSVETLGVKWATPASGGGMTLLSTTTLSGTATTITIDPTGYIALGISIEGIDMSAGGDGAVISINNSGNAQLALIRYIGSTATTGGVANTTIAYQNGDDMDGSSNNAGWMNIYNPTSTTNWKPMDVRLGWVTNGGSNSAWIGGGVFKSNSAISSIVFTRAISATFSGGTIKVYGVK